MQLATKQFGDLAIVDADWPTWATAVGEQLMVAGSPLQIVLTPNPEQLVRASRCPAFHEDLRRADWLLPDGQGLVWAAGVRARLTGADTLVEVLAVAREQQQRVLLVGGRYTSAHPPKLTIPLTTGSYDIFYTSGYQNISQPTQSETKAVEALISDLHPAVVLVALGAPHQERWLIDHRDFLASQGVKLALAIGGGMDFLLGQAKRAPHKWQQLKIEWLWRLIHEPWRWRRQLALPYFWWLTVTGYWQKQFGKNC